MPKKIDANFAVSIMLKGGWKPLEAYPGALSKWKCQCISCGYVGTPKFANVQRGSGCIICKNANKNNPKKISQPRAVQILKQANARPLESYVNSHKKWKAECLGCGKTIYPLLTNIMQGHKACAYCSSHKVDPIEAERLMRLNFLQPLSDFKNVDSKWKSQCMKCDRIVYPSYASIKRGQGGCVSCGKKSMANKQAVPDREASAIMRSAGLEPLEPYPKKANKRWKCKCLKCKKIVFPSFANVKSGHQGCAYCSGKKIDEVDAVEFMKLKGYEPLEPYRGNKNKWKVKHLNCGRIVYPAYNTIQSGQGGCSFCAPYGIKMEEPSYIYLITHQELSAHKIGIGNNTKLKKKDRLHRLNFVGWQTIKKWDVETGKHALEIEKEIFTHIRKNLGIPVFLAAENMAKLGGHTETMDADSISLLELERIIQEKIKGYGK